MASARHLIVFSVRYAFMRLSTGGHEALAGASDDLRRSPVGGVAGRSKCTDTSHQGTGSIPHLARVYYETQGLIDQ